MRISLVKAAWRSGLAGEGRHGPAYLSASLAQKAIVFQNSVSIIGNQSIT
jgi:hypothetical protein